MKQLSQSGASRASGVFVLTCVLFAGVSPMAQNQKSAPPAATNATAPAATREAVNPQEKNTGLRPEQMSLPLPQPVFKAAPAIAKQFVMEYITNYSRMDYTPTVVVQPVPKTADSYKTPEETFLTQFSAMMSGDYDRWISGFDDNAKAVLAKRDQEQHRTPTFWIDRWKGA